MRETTLYMDRLMARQAQRRRKAACPHAELEELDCATYELEISACQACGTCMGVDGERCDGCECGGG